MSEQERKPEETKPVVQLPPLPVLHLFATEGINFDGRRLMYHGSGPAKAIYDTRAEAEGGHSKYAIATRPIPVVLIPKEEYERLQGLQVKVDPEGELLSKTPYAERIDTTYDILAKVLKIVSRGEAPGISFEVVAGQVQKALDSGRWSQAATDSVADALRALLAAVDTSIADTRNGHSGNWYSIAAGIRGRADGHDISGLPLHMLQSAKDHWPRLRDAIAGAKAALRQE